MNLILRGPHMEDCPGMGRYESERLPMVSACSTGYCSCAAKDAELARLRATNTELLAALEAVLASDGCMGTYDFVALNAAKATALSAIAKAKGETA